MTIIEAYNDAISRPAHEIPKIVLRMSSFGREFVIVANHAAKVMCLVNAPATQGHICLELTTPELVSDKWEVVVIKDKP